MSLLFINLFRNNTLKCAFKISNAIDINKYKPHKQEKKTKQKNCFVLAVLGIR